MTATPTKPNHTTDAARRCGGRAGVPAGDGRRAHEGGAQGGTGRGEAARGTHAGSEVEGQAGADVETAGVTYFGRLRDEAVASISAIFSSTINESHAPNDRLSAFANRSAFRRNASSNRNVKFENPSAFVIATHFLLTVPILSYISRITNCQEEAVEWRTEIRNRASWTFRKSVG